MKEKIKIYLLKRRIIVLLLLSLLFVSCPKNEKVVATVGNSKLTQKELLVQIPSEIRLTKENINALIEKWINTELLYQEAKRRRLDQDETLKIQIKQLSKELIVNSLLEREMAKISVSRKEIFDYFTQHKEEFLYEVKISRIVLSDESLAHRTLAELRAGADFTRLAQDLSQDRVLAKGAESKYFSRGVGDPRVGGDPLLEEAIFKLKVGEISDVLKSQEGYQIVKLIDKKKVKKDISLAEVEDYINSVLQYKKSREMLEALLNDLKARTKITQNPDVLLK
ncbi:MAG: peptidyl-prolyl cis-trans isomerase [candidate division WOR-3 bacterium]|nr:peptidyl-prolyl cis-trans isomerase [candidate division WOR-3 bacterium]